MKISPVFPILLTTLFSFAGADAGRPPVDHKLSAQFMPLRFHVKDAALRSKLAGALRNQPQDSIAWGSWEGDNLNLSADMAVRLGAFSDPAEKFRVGARKALERLSGSGIEEDEGVTGAAAYYPNDSLFNTPQQWGLYNKGDTIAYTPGKAGADVGMTRVWDRYDGDDSLVIAVVDAGFNFKHPDLQGRWFRNTAEINGAPGVDDDHNGMVDDTAGWDFVDNDNLPQDYEGHGSMTSGLIAATFDNGKGIAGMIPRVRILPIRVLNAAGVGTLNGIAAGIQYALKMHVSAINFSIGGGWSSANTAMRTAFQAARDSGVPIIVAAGNDHINLDSVSLTPFSYGFTNTYTVTSHTVGANLSGFSNYGPNTVPFAAPGDQLTSTCIPPNIPAFAETFDSGDTGWSFAAAGNFVLSTSSPLQGTQTLAWSAGTNTWAATNGTIDLTGKVGSTLVFTLDYTPASTRDFLIVEGQAQGSTQWTQFALINSAVSKGTLSFDTHAMDGLRYKLRFRTLVTGAVTGRVLRLDDIHAYSVDLSPANQSTAYQLSGGTSFSAPYLSGYIGLLRIACRRTNTTFTRALVLAAAVPESALAGKVGGRLDVSKGLAFYLNTLPGLAVTDSTRTSWLMGDTVHYSLSVSGAAASAYAFKDLTTLTTSTLTADGKFSWVSTGGATGKDTVRFRAEGNPLVLRKLVVFTLNPRVVGVAAKNKSIANSLWIGERAFVLPSSFFQKPNHDLRIASIEADGRMHEVFSGGVETPATSGKAGYQFPGLTGVGWRVWVDGSPLQPLRGE